VRNERRRGASEGFVRWAVKWGGAGTGGELAQDSQETLFKLRGGRDIDHGAAAEPPGTD
jgi:hypothetical protein